MKTTYKQRIFGYFLLIFIIFTGGIILIEQRQEKKFRIADLEVRLDGYTGIINSYIVHNRLTGESIGQIHELYHLLPDSIRVSIIDNGGKVLLDNEVTDVEHMENHLDRPEIRNALYSSFGSNVRSSASTHQEYLYYARHYDNYFVRVALPYNTETRNMLKAGNLFIILTLVLFVVVLLFINYVASSFSNSILQLKDFASKIKKGQPIPDDVNFHNDELGEIGYELIDIFKQKEAANQSIELERQKLIRHFQFSGEGLCIFNPERKKIYANTNFIQYINLISDNPTFDVEDILNDKMFQPVTDFINNKKREVNHADFQIQKNAKTFSVQTVAFKDGSFEVIIKDISKTEKTRLLKQEMTSNIAHELRTPVTSLRGYMETLYDHELSPEKQGQFIERAYLQTVRLSNLIEDVSIISKIEDAPSQFAIEDLSLAQLIDEVQIDLSDKLMAHRITFFSLVKDTLYVRGNYTLIYSIFRNLIDNSISYAGNGIEIHITNYAEDDTYLYFSYYDTGTGVDEQHLNRIFERFYRVNEGRTRETGGSGLGLSIVKNAILFHKGTIEVKNHAGGGLEFLFTLKK
ncbi:two-component sensor histidine kinase [Bacteroidia bacterium]|nr:two-component sensor histidine kinase [Bacteroidia bacterium]GHV03543.1 two-component sensor histidine kinase [Bacteroidia bacterium]